MIPTFVGVTGLPRAGSTLLCQLLSQHPQIHSEGQSSPLCYLVLGIPRMARDDQFFLAQLDRSFERSYAHLCGAGQPVPCGEREAWVTFAVVDKNRAWLHA